MPTLPLALREYLPPSLWEQLQIEPGRRGLLLDALNTLQSFLYLLSTYLPPPLIERLKRDPAPARVTAEVLEGSLLFADVSGFTALSERLAGEGNAGIEALTGHLNDYFDTMVQILARSDGALLKFAGDALLAYFPSQDEGRHAQWATRAAHRMMRAMNAFAALKTPGGPIALRMKIGLASGPFIAATVGAPARMEYVLLGETVARTLALEGTLSAGQIGVDAATAALLDPAQVLPHVNAFSLLAPDSGEGRADFEIRPETQRRARSSGLLMAPHEELYAHLEVALRQIEVLRAFLPGSLGAALLAYASQRQLPAENRPAASIFFNLTGIEALWDPAEPATASRALTALDACFRAVESSVARYGGIISRIDPYRTGSKILALFGAPTAHEDDPLRAVRAALEAQAALANLRARWDVALRAGIAYGPTFAGPVGAAIRREYTLMGDDVNLAARLMGAAQPGQILVAPAVAAFVRANVALKPLAPLQLKGKREPVPVSAVEGLRRDPLLYRLALRGPLVGRDEALARARAALQEALGGHGSLLTVIGGPGMGKSHFADALAAEARAAGVRVHLSACAAHTAATPYAPWIGLLRLLAGMAPELGREEAARRFGDWLAQQRCEAREIAVPLLQLLDLPANATPVAVPLPAATAAQAGLFQRLGEQAHTAPATLPKASLWQLARERQHVTSNSDTWQRLERRIADRTQARLFVACEGLLAALARQTPRLFIFEDAQWLDAPSRRLLAHLAEALTGSAVLFLVTQRPTDAALTPLPGEVLPLEPLSLADSGALAAQLLGAAAALPALTRAIAERAEGNPLFVEELCAWCCRTGSQDLESGLRHSLTLQELVLSRLDALSYTEKELARVASVVGNDFDVPALLALTADSAAAQLFPALEGLERARFTFSVETQQRYAFCQTLVRELLYDSQPRARRGVLHARLAEYLRAAYAADPAAIAEVLLYHYGQAGIWLEATRYALLAAGKAQCRATYDEALAFYAVAEDALTHLEPELAAMPEAHDLRGRLRAGQGDVAFLQGRFGAAARAYGAALLDLPDLSPLLARLALAQPLAALPDTSPLDLAQRAWQMRPPTPETEVPLAALLAWLHWRSGAAAPPVEVECRECRPLLALFDGDFQAAWEMFQAEGEPSGAALAALWRAEKLAQTGDLPAARVWLTQASAIWARENDPWGEALGHFQEARLYGTAAAAVSALEEARSLLRQTQLLLLAGELPVPDLKGDLLATGASWEQLYADVFCALYIFDLLTPLSPEVQCTGAAREPNVISIAQ